MVGINVPIPVPVSILPFGGWKQSLFGDLHMYGPGRNQVLHAHESRDDTLAAGERRECVPYAGHHVGSSRGFRRGFTTRVHEVHTGVPDGGSARRYRVIARGRAIALNCRHKPSS